MATGNVEGEKGVRPVAPNGRRGRVGPLTGWAPARPTTQNGMHGMRFSYCVGIAFLLNILGLYLFGSIMKARASEAQPTRTKISIAALPLPPDSTEPAEIARPLAVPPGEAGIGRGAVGPANRAGTFGHGGEANWDATGPTADAQAPGYPAAPGMAGMPAMGANMEPMPGLGGDERTLTPSPHEVANPHSSESPQPAAHGVGYEDTRPIGELSPDPIKPHSVTAGQAGPGEYAPGAGKPAAGDGSGPGAGPGRGGTATPGASPTVQPGERGGRGGAGGASGGSGGGAGGGTVGGTGRGGVGNGPGRGAGTSGTGTGAGGGTGAAAGSPAGGAGGAAAGGGGTTAGPVVISGGRPPRTREMERLGVHGAISVRVSVDASGNVTGATVVGGRSGYSDYDNAAASFVRNNWRFKPAKRNGQAVAGTVTVSVSY
jgi:TonB family protein